MSANFRMRNHFLLAVASVAILLTGCDEINGMKQEKIIRTTSASLDPKLEEAVAPEGRVVSSDPLTISEGIWVGNQAMRMRRGQPLPASMDTDNGFSLISTNALTLAEIATQIANNTNIPVRMGDMTLSASGTSTSGASPISGANAPTMSLSYSGPLTTFLDQVASQFNVSWRFDGKGIYLFRYESKTFTVESMPSKLSLNDEFDTGSSSSGSSSSGSSGGSSSDTIKQKNTQTAEIDYWKDLETSIKGILGDEGSVTFMPSSGTVTITALPTKVAEVGRFLDAENRRLGRQIAIDLVIYNVTLNSTNNYGLDLSGALSGSKLFGNNARGTLTANGPNVPGISGFTTTTAGTLSVALVSPHWSPTLIPTALSTIGNVSEITRSPIITLNNRPASREITVDKAYLASTTPGTSTTTGGSTTVSQPTLTPGIVSSGLGVQMLPRIMDDGRILLQYSIKLSDVLSISSASSGSGASQATIQTPETSNKVFVQQAMMQNGSTLILAGFDKNSNSNNENGTGSASNWLLGGGTANNTKREQLVITITPREITPERGSAQGS